MSIIFIFMMCTLSGFMGYEFGLERCEDRRQIEELQQKIEEIRAKEVEEND